MPGPLSLEIPPEPKLPYRLWWPALEHHATALGYICMNYAALEFQINLFIEYALACSRDQRRAIIDATGTRLEDRCVLLKKLVALTCPSDAFYADLEALLAPIGNEISGPRNRLIHDVWITGEPIKQWDMRTKLRQPQAGEPKGITQPVEPERSLESLWELVRRLQELCVWVGTLSTDYAIWRQSGRMPKSPQLPEHLYRRPDRAGAGQPTPEEPQPQQTPSAE